jgi:VanZ family protein
MRRFVQYWGPPLALMGSIFFLSAQSNLPGAPSPWLEMLLKKGGHATVYGVLAWLYWRALDHHLGDRCTPWTIHVASFLLALLYGASDEYHQTFVPGRNGNLFDVGIDGLGAAITTGLNHWRQQRHSPDPSQPHPD